jgi:hypothetical protein
LRTFVHGAAFLLAETSVCGAALMGPLKLLASNPHAPYFSLS